LILSKQGKSTIRHAINRTSVEMGVFKKYKKGQKAWELTVKHKPLPRRRLRHPLHSPWSYYEEHMSWF